MIEWPTRPDESPTPPPLPQPPSQTTATTTTTTAAAAATATVATEKSRGKPRSPLSVRVPDTNGSESPRKKKERKTR